MMFFKKKAEKGPDSPSAIDKIVMGLIIGGAIGSIVGLSVAPEKGSETRGRLKTSSQLGIKIIKVIFGVLKERFKKLINKKNKS